MDLRYSFPQAAASTRRDFLKTASLGLGAAALATPTLSPLAPTHAQARGRTLGVALVGLGNYATNQLAPALQHTRQCRLAGIVTGTPAKADTWSEKYSIPRTHIYNYETFDRIADNDDIDIVYVVLPNAMHAEYTIRAAQAGKHVISEKPMGISVSECEAMIAACNAAGVKLSIGYRLHFEPHNREAMRLGQDQVFGAVKVIESSFGFRIGNPNQWRLDKELSGGGALMDVGIYAIQAARYVTGEEPVAVTAQAFTTDPVMFKEVHETIFWQLEFPGGAISNSTTSYGSYVERLYASCERGWFELGPAYSYSGIQGRTSQGPMDFPQVVQQAGQMDDFADCILNNRRSEVSGEEGLRDMKIIEAIYKAVETGENVRIE